MTQLISSYFTLTEVKNILMQTNSVFEGLNPAEFDAKIQYVGSEARFVIERRQF